METKRPTNPSDISFASHCFVQDGTRTEYSVLRSALHSGPAVFANREKAEAFARRAGRPITETTVRVMKRIAWK